MLKVLKNTSIFFLIFLILVSSNLFLTVNAHETTSHHLHHSKENFGDVNADGYRSSEDARILLRCSVKLENTTEFVLYRGDYDNDGVISSEDARTALRVAVGLDSVECMISGHILCEKIISPSCTENGYSINKCKNCYYTEDVKFNIINTSGHKYIEKSEMASCTSDGLSYLQCENCNEIINKTVTEQAKGHSFSYWKADGETKTRTCKTCSFSETKANVKTIYLTFDDGPGPYTEKLLNYLKEYDVKATFFVTNQNSKYKYLLKEIVDDGHSIGVHSYTHQWSIYASKTNYLNDFNAMHDLIYKETGVDTKIFRFPGGTNNTVSKKQSKGIMSQLSKMMLDKGYVYYDWNVDCYDTLGYNSSKIAQSTINQISKKHTSIVLMHDIKNSTVESVKTIIEYGLKNGYEFAAIDESTPVIAFKPAN